MIISILFILLVNQAFAEEAPPLLPTLTEKTPLIGVILPSQQKKNYIHKFLFQFQGGKWQGAHVGLSGSPVDPETKKRTWSFSHNIKDSLHFSTKLKLYFDDTVVQEVSIKAKQLCLPATALNQRAKKILGQDRMLLSSNGVPRDPDEWKLLPEKSKPVELSQLSKLIQEKDYSCYKQIKKEGTDSWEIVRDGRRPEVETLKVYAPKDKSRLLVVARKKQGCEGQNDSDRSTQLWFFRDRQNQWIVRSGIDFIDIGDFNGDGKSEAIFESDGESPSRYWQIVDLERFDVLVEAMGSGYDDESTCL
jgi:hypothetical protein